MVDRDRDAAPMTEDQRAAKFVQPEGSTSVSDGDESTTPEALAYLLEHGAEAWSRRYARAADTGGTVG